jgi:UDP-glucuronate decarboxylase
MFDYHREHGVDIRVARIFNTYGPFMHPFDGRVVSNFIRQALAGEDITIFGDGQQSRSFCYVDDLIDGFLLMMDADEATGPINLGNPGEFTMLELASLVLELTGGDSELVMKPLPADDPIQRQPDITRAKTVLNWTPSIPLKEGLQKTIEWFAGIDVSQWSPPTPNWEGGLIESS